MFFKDNSLIQQRYDYVNGLGLEVEIEYDIKEIHLNDYPLGILSSIFPRLRQDTIKYLEANPFDRSSLKLSLNRNLFDLLPYIVSLYNF